jgi:molecular chaperone GrpE (heat shock protein)
MLENVPQNSEIFDENIFEDGYEENTSEIKDEADSEESMASKCSLETIESEISIIKLLNRIETLQQVINNELTDMNRKYHNGFADVINRQQTELDSFREGLGRNVLVGLLKTIAETYSDYEKYSNCDDFEKMKKCFNSLMEELLQILHENGVMERKSIAGDKYSVKYCKPYEKEKIGDMERHGEIVESRNVGFYVDKTVLVPERVKIYVYDEFYKKNETEE